MMAPDTKMLDLAREIGRLSPDWSNPERYIHQTPPNVPPAAHLYSRELRGLAHG
ncbi:MAG: hypothetical protein WKF52_08935 [Sphingomicrobium sp.]